MEKQLDTHIKAIRSNRGGEYLSNEFIDHLVQNEILSQLTAPSTPQQNGVAERRNQTLLDITRSMMSYSEFPLFLWSYALETAIYILNLVPRKSIPKNHERCGLGTSPLCNISRYGGVRHMC